MALNRNLPRRRTLTTITRIFTGALNFCRRQVDPTHSNISIGNENLRMLPNEYRGKLVRICKGKGRGQERLVLSNTDTRCHCRRSGRRSRIRPACSLWWSQPGILQR